MNLFQQPRSFGDSYGLAMWLLRISGLFPYIYVTKQRKFVFSWMLFAVTITHAIVYGYVNITLLKDDWLTYVQPLIGNSSLAAIGNMVLRFSGVVITFAILGPVLFGSKPYVSVLNQYVSINEEFVALGIRTLSINRTVYYISCIASVFTASVLVFGSWHSVYFYELIIHKAPTLKYYIVVVLSNYYKTMFLFFAWLQIFSIYCMSHELNHFLKDIVQKQKRLYESERQPQVTPWVH